MNIWLYGSGACHVHHTTRPEPLRAVAAAVLYLQAYDPIAQCSYVFFQAKAAVARTIKHASLRAVTSSHLVTLNYYTSYLYAAHDHAHLNFALARQQVSVLLQWWVKTAPPHA